MNRKSGKWAAALMLCALMGTSAAAEVYRLDDTADEISVAQQILTEMKLYSADITGHFGSKTQAAVLAFQKKYALEQNGTLDEETMDALYEAAGMDPSEPSSGTAGTSNLLRLGDENSSVLQLQQDLSYLRYYTGSITGHFGNLTQEAVRKFQKASGLSADGVAGEKTLSALEAAMSKSSGESFSSSGSTDNSLLKEGTKSDAVRQLQEDLTALGYYTGNVTGNFGSLTKEAVMKFQRACGLTADGIAGSKTLARIADALSASSSSSSSVSSSSGSTLVLNTDNTLSLGSSSSEVKKLQQMLKALGYYSGNISGSFGDLTEASVLQYQQKNSLTADGIAGSKTLSLINAQYAMLTISNIDVAAMAASVSNDNFYNWRSRYDNGETCLVYDYHTGYAWTLRIMSKDAHMDAEPYTLEDTEKMNRAFGGETTWTPKPVWVTFSDGRTYLGTTHNTPHEPYHLTNNGFDGHLCVHFTISMEKAESIGDYAVSHQEALLKAWDETKQLAR